MKTGIPALAALFSILLISGCGKAVAEDPSPPPTWTISGFSTDFSRTGIDSSEIISGGPGKDGIPAIDSPEYESIESAGSRIADREPVILVRINGKARIYPIQILTWHEIVNDKIGERPIAVTYCPLCNTGIVFDRRIDDSTLDFGTTGHLSGSNLIMYDRQTESWWQQASGEAIVGDYLGRKLDFLPSLTLSFEDAVKAVPDADVLSPPASVRRSYGTNPYEGYDSPGNRPFLFRGPIDVKNPMERVLLIVHKEETRNIPYAEAQSRKVLNFVLSGDPVVVFWTSGTVSALDSRRISEGRDVGTANAFLARLDGRNLEFESGDDGFFTDRNTGSRWDGIGRGLEGALAGLELQPLVGIQHFAFSAEAFTD